MADEDRGKLKLSELDLAGLDGEFYQQLLALLGALAQKSVIDLSVDTVDKNGSVVVGRAALSTSAVDGFLYIPSSPGVPTGVPTSKTGMIAVDVDSTGKVVYFYIGGQWVTAFGDPAPASSPWSTGDVKLTMKTAADTGWVMCNDGTIGDASSGGTTRANADTSALFTLLWTNVIDTWAPVSGGRGGSAAADFAAHKTIALTKMLGRALAISGAGSGLTSRALGEKLGVETYALITAELPVHLHGVSITSGGQSADHTHSGSTNESTIWNTGGTSSGLGPAAGVWEFKQGTFTTGGASADHTHTVSGNTGNTGSGTAHQNMQPTSFLNAMIKL